MFAEAHRGAIVCVLAVLVSLLPECHAQLRSPGAPKLGIEHGFLLWKLQDAAAAQVRVKACAEQHVGQELLSLCKDVGSERETETQIAKGYLFLIFGEKAPGQAPPQASLDGVKFENKFLKQTIQQDHEGLRRARSCLVKASRSEVLNFCHLVERSRFLELQLLENQLCQLQKNCRTKSSNK